MSAPVIQLWRIVTLGASLYSMNAELSIDLVDDTPPSPCHWLTRCLRSVGLVGLIDSSGKIGLLEGSYSNRKKQTPNKTNRELCS